MSVEPDLGARIRFGMFQLDLANRRLLKGATTQVDIPFESYLVLKALATRPGELVRRRELQQIVWSEGEALGVDDGLTAAVDLARLALGDSEKKPKFIETVGGDGYRFIAPVRSNIILSRRRPNRRRAPWEVYATVFAVLTISLLLLVYLYPE